MKMYHILIGLAITFVAILVCFAFAAISDSQSKATDSNGLPLGVHKFRDGNNTCYAYYDHALSCVRGE